MYGIQPEEIESMREMLGCLLFKPEQLSVGWAVERGIFVLMVSASAIDVPRVLRMQGVLLEMVRVFTEAETYRVDILVNSGAQDSPSVRRATEPYTVH